MSLKGNLKYKTIYVPTEKKIIKIDKDGHETVEIKSYKIKFIDSERFTARSSSNLVDNLTGAIHKNKCKFCGCFIEYKRVKGNLIIYKCLSCNSKSCNS